MAHILFMDIVAYSTLLMDHQQRILDELQDAVRSTPTFARAEATDNLIRLPTGDGMALVFFENPEAPARCALELTETLRRRNSNINLRIGIHSGPVYRIADINTNRNVAGGGINTAQRVMDCGDAGHILVSQTTSEMLAQVSAWNGALHDLGSTRVKHGQLIRISNFYIDGLGNPEAPKKLRTRSLTLLFRKHFVTVSFGLASIIVLAFVVMYSRHSASNKEDLQSAIPPLPTASPANGSIPGAAQTGPSMPDSPINESWLGDYSHPWQHGPRGAGSMGEHWRVLIRSDNEIVMQYLSDQGKDTPISCNATWTGV
jgi:hypothetical protein